MRLRLEFTVVCLAGMSLRASAQLPVQSVFADCPPGLPVFKEAAVQVPAKFLPDPTVRPIPVKAQLDSANVVRFVVDTTGTVDPKTFVGLHVADSAIFRRAQNNMGRWRFEPARASGCRVRQFVVASLSP